MGAIDMHVHLPTKEYFVSFGEYMEAQTKFFRADLSKKEVEEMVGDFDEAGVEKAVILGWDAETTTGLPRVPNEHIAKLVEMYPNRFIGFAGIDPHKGALAVREIERTVKDLGLKGLKFHQSVQAFEPSDPKFRPLWEKAVELDVAVLFHMGMAAWGAGMRGGAGVKLKYGHPMHIDDLAAEFPDLRIIGAHPAWPWQEEMIAVAMHKPNVYIDLSGWSPRYFPQILIQYANSLISDKCLFGSDYPFIKPKRWLEEFVKLGFKPENVEKILEKNAKRFLRL